jgi:hypothetical protein
VPIVTKQIREGPHFDYRILAVAERNAEGRLICPTIDFFQDAEAREGESLAKMSAHLDHLAFIGTIRDPDKFKPLRNSTEFQELRTSRGLRLICFRTENREIICTNGAIKKKDDLEDSDVASAKRWRNLYLEAKKTGKLSHEPEPIR